ncbi:PBSX family phage terminase large subunit [Fructilactobacillus frigidiflavus]|uniref:PBSX family phage terminase large subunit n=1 Tax=Fructilactobacillus frigidiflavus TaxID=3242688 RepID=UPI0037571B39
MAIELEFPHPDKVFNEQFEKSLFDYKTFTEVYYGGASSGKSHGVVQKVILKACKRWKYPRKILWLRKVGATVKESIFADVQSCLSDFGLLPLCKVNKSNYEIQLPNGAVFLFSGLDDPEKIKSVKGLSDVVMEEATEFNLEDYTQLTLRLRERKHKDKQLFLMFNPVSKLNWVYKHFFEKKQADVKIIHSTYRDNRFLDERTRKTIQQLEQTNPAYYRIYALGEFATLDKLVFPRYEKRRLNLDTPEMVRLPSYFGLDFGFTNDPSAFMHLKVDVKNKVIYFVEEYVKQHMLNDDIAKMIKQMRYAKEVITADAAEKKSIAEIRRDGVYRIKPALKGPDSIVQGIAFMNQFKFVVDDRCVKLIEELENYTYKKDKQTNEYTNYPVDSYNHCIDACRYALDPINGHGTPKAMIFKNNFI